MGESYKLYSSFNSGKGGAAYLKWAFPKAFNKAGDGDGKQATFELVSGTAAHWSADSTFLCATPRQDVKRGYFAAPPPFFFVLPRLTM